MAGNWVMFKWIEELSYTDPYIYNPRNNWNSPYLDKTVRELRKEKKLGKSLNHYQNHTKY